jgi:Xaa-Pro aminopeptidase
MKGKKEEKVISYREYLPRFSLEERDRRWAAIRDEMGLLDLDCLLLVGNDRFFGYGNSNVRYVAQIDGQRMGAVVIFPLNGAPVAFSSPPHMHDKPFPVYKAFNDWVTDTRPMAGLKPVVESLKAMGCEKANIGLVSFKGTFRSSTISFQEHAFLLTELPGAHFSEATHIIERLREIKSPEEIEMLKKSGEISRLKIESMIKMAAPGVKECELFAEMVKTEISQGGEAFVFNLLTSGSVTDTEHIQHLLHGRGQSLSPTTRPFRQGDIVMTEFHTSYGGYLTACEKTVFLGKPPRELQRIHDVGVECLENGFQKFRPGVTRQEVLEAFRAPAKKARIDYIELGFHGHGLSSPEFPANIYTSSKGDIMGEGSTSSVLRENMVFGTNIDIHDPAWRKDVGIMGPGDTIWVSEKGPVKLIGTPLEFAIV